MSTYYRMSAQQRADNDRQARKDKAKSKRKGHKAGQAAKDVAHKRYERDMGL